MTDAPKHNLALMRISAHYKRKGDKVFIGGSQDDCDLSYGSWLFSVGGHTDMSGGPGTDRKTDRLDDYGISEYVMPDYSLYPTLDYSLGYTWEYCPNRCEFCVTKDQKHTPRVHTSIHEFHNPAFKRICLLNNNTFTDPYWRETFLEIKDAGLTVIDENGYDLRLLDKEKVYWLNALSFDGIVHFAFDRIEDEPKIRAGLELLKRLKHRSQIYVLVGYPDSRPIDETDIARCRIIAEAGFDPYIMVYNRVVRSKEPRMLELNRFQRMVNRCYTWRKLGFELAWKEYYRPVRSTKS
jgi:hypothetical protein